MPVSKAPCFKRAAIQKSAWRLYCKKITPAGADVWKSGMDMGADTILSMTIIAWAFLPVNRNAVPVCVICAPIWYQREIMWKIIAKLVEIQMW